METPTPLQRFLPLARHVLLAVMVVGGLALSMADRAGDSLRPRLLFFALLAAALVDAPRGAEALRRRLGAAGLLVGGMLLLGEGVRLLSPGAGSFGFHRDVLLLHLRAPISMVLFAWFAAPWFLVWRGALEGALPRRFLAAHLGAVVAFFAWRWATAYASSMPALSMDQFPDEDGVFLTLFVVLVRWLPAMTQWKQWPQACFLAMACWAALAASVVLTAYHVGPDTMRARLTQQSHRSAGMVVVEPGEDGPITRLATPMQHHNRTAFVLGLSALILTGAGVMARRWPWRVALAVLAIAAVVCLAATLNRGAVLALAGALLVAGLAAFQLRALWVLPFLIVGAFLLPESVAERLQTLIDPETYKDPMSTAVTRMQLWQASGALIADHPITGVGFGWEVVAKWQGDYATREAIQLDVNHAHNVWIEYAAESGAPGAAVYFALSLFRLLLIVSLLRGISQWDAARVMLLLLLAIDVYIQLTGLTNFQFRRGLGVIIWMGWGVAVALLADFARASAARDSAPPIA